MNRERWGRKRQWPILIIEKFASKNWRKPHMLLITKTVTEALGLMWYWPSSVTECFHVSYRDFSAHKITTFYCKPLATGLRGGISSSPMATTGKCFSLFFSSSLSALFLADPCLFPMFQTQYQIPHRYCVPIFLITYVTNKFPGTVDFLTSLKHFQQQKYLTKRLIQNVQECLFIRPMSPNLTHLAIK